MNFLRNLATQPAVNRASEVAAEVAEAAAARLDELFSTDGLPRPQQQQQQAPGGPPPASAAALRQLPTISVTAEDLVEESNRECCICFEK